MFPTGQSQGTIEREHHHDFIRFEMLRKEYLNQTFNFMPELRKGYDNAAKSQYYEYAQVPPLQCQKIKARMLIKL